MSVIEHSPYHSLTDPGLRLAGSTASIKAISVLTKDPGIIILAAI